MSAKKTERLLNLVICLLATRRHLSVQQIRQAVPGYDTGSEDAFRRMFERDKEELRELGIPLETGSDSHAHDDEPGYRIARRDYELPDVVLEADEAAALSLAARLWQSAPLAGAVASGLLKLQAGGVDVSWVGPLEPRVSAGEASFGPCLAAVRDGYPVTFDYRTPHRPQPRCRRVEPWGVVCWHGRWYLVGHDTERDATRVFRLSRMTGQVQPDGPPGSVTVPPGVDLRASVARMAGEPVRDTATVRVRAGTCWALREAATRLRPGAGWDELQVGFADPERLADRVAGFGADAVVVAPEPARAAVAARLRAALDAVDRPTDAAATR